MAQAEAISFDLWGTLIQSNPTYKDAKIGILKRYTKYDVNFIGNSILNLKKDFDNMVERYGVAFKSSQVFDALFDVLDVSQDFRPSVIYKLESEFLKHPPLLVSDEVIKVLNKLKEQYQLVLVSNTMFISGQTLRASLPSLFNKFDFVKFSDSSGYSKPSVKITNHLFVNNSFYHICHVGDNDKTDGEYARRRNVRFILVNQSDSPTSIDGLLDQI